jgi:hypothetical protein
MFETPFVQDIYDYVDQQIETISEILNQKDLKTFIFVLLDCLELCTANLIKNDLVLETEIIEEREKLGKP